MKGRYCAATDPSQHCNHLPIGCFQYRREKQWVPSLDNIIHPSFHSARKRWTKHRKGLQGFLSPQLPVQLVASGIKRSQNLGLLSQTLKPLTEEIGGGTVWQSRLFSTMFTLQ